MSEDLKRLIVARGQSKGFMTRLKAYIRDLDPGNYDLAIFREKRDRLDKVYTEYTELKLEISLIDSNDKEVVDIIEEAYFEMAAFFNALITPIPEPVAATPGPAPSAPGPSASLQRLPRIEIEKFSGEVGQYHDFITLYSSRVINKDTNLSQCDKFYYLRSLLRGDAFK
jgi:hypothetical protein